MSIYLQTETNRVPLHQFSSCFFATSSQQSQMSPVCIHLHSSEDVSTMSKSKLCSIFQNTWPPHTKTWPYGSLQNQTTNHNVHTFISWQEHCQLPWLCLMFRWFEAATNLLILVFRTPWTSSLECFPAVYSALSGFLKWITFQYIPLSTAQWRPYTMQIVQRWINLMKVCWTVCQVT